MAEKKRPTLSELLKKFAEAGEAPELSEEELAAQQAAEQAAAQVPPSSAPDGGTSAGEVAEAAAQAAASEEQAVDAGQALCDIAQQYIDEHNEALGKEAQIFGEIFARAAVSEMRSQAGQTEDELLRQKCASVYEDAYAVTMRKLADEGAGEGGVSPDVLQALLASGDSSGGEAGEISSTGHDSPEEGISPEEEREVSEAVYDAVLRQMEDADPEGDEDDLSPGHEETLAQSAYDAVMRQLSEDESDEGEDGIDYPAVTDNAYRAAMAELGV